MKLYVVDEEYIKYLNQFDSKVSLGHEGGKTRKYICVKLTINQKDYLVPMSSPDSADYVNGKVRKSFFPAILRLIRVEKDRRRFLGKLLFNNMIPCAKESYQLYDLNQESDNTYKNLVLMQLAIINREFKKGNIQKYADTIYKRKMENLDVPYIHATLDFSLLEDVSKNWKKL